MGGGLQGRASAQPGAWGSDQPLHRITLGLQLPSFLPSGPVSAEVGSLLHGAGQTRPFAFSSFLVLLRDELLPQFPFGNASFQQQWDPGAQGGPVLKSCWMFLCSSFPLRLNPFPPPHLPPHPLFSHLPILPCRSQVVALKSFSGVAPG